MRKCPKCEYCTDNDLAKFCKKCGSELVLTQPTIIQVNSKPMDKNFSSLGWYLKCWQQYADFSGRARRKEYWMFCLFNFLASFAFGFIDGILGTTLFSVIYTLLVFIPSLSVCVRRLHDVGKSGWMYLMILIPIVGAIWLLVLFCKDSQPGRNKWGENPKEIVGSI